MFKVHIHSDGFNFYLKGTTCTGDILRADKFDSHEDAQKALNKAKKFMVLARFKLARVIEMV
jgi:hypothetical protein